MDPEGGFISLHHVLFGEAVTKQTLAKLVHMLADYARELDDELTMSFRKPRHRHPPRLAPTGAVALTEFLLDTWPAPWAGERAERDQSLGAQSCATLT